MASKEEIDIYETRYKEGNTPWDIGRPDKNLKRMLNQIPLQADAKVLDIGCGTGDNAIFMAKQGLDVTGTEIVPMALEQAKKKAAQNKVGVTWLLKDITEEDIPGAPFDLVFDRGCFHHYGDQAKRALFAKRIFEHLVPGGYWLSLIGNADEDRPGPGPPQRRALEVVQAVEPCFELLLLRSGHFDSNMNPPPRCWILLAKRRNSIIELKE